MKKKTRSMLAEELTKRILDKAKIRETIGNYPEIKELKNVVRGYITIDDGISHVNYECPKCGNHTKKDGTHPYYSWACPECGNKMCGDSSKKKYGLYKSYRCAKRGRECQNFVTISELSLEKQMLNKLKDQLREEIARVELEESKPKPKKSNLKSLKEKQRRLTVAYMAGNLSDEEYLKSDAELKALIAKAESEEPPKPRDLTPLRELLETDIEAIYVTFTDEEKQRFWQSLVKEIQLDGKTVTRVIFF